MAAIDSGLLAFVTNSTINPFTGPYMTQKILVATLAGAVAIFLGNVAFAAYVKNQAA